MLLSMLRSLIGRKAPQQHVTDLPDRGTEGAKRMLNVGGGSKMIPIPMHYEKWDHLLLDIDPAGGAEVVCDARELTTLGPEQFDAVYCSHNLEHYFEHDVTKVLNGFMHVLKTDGFTEIKVPDMPAVFRHMVEHGLDINAELYRSNHHSIRIIDVIYGWALQIRESGNDYYAHKTGFSFTTLCSALHAAGFVEVWNAPPYSDFEIRVVAFKQTSTPEHRSLLGIPLHLEGASEEGFERVERES